MNICIYCSSEADSLEHPLPAAFGEFEGAPMLAHRLCKRCNNTRLGVLDEQLSRSGPEAVIRQFYGLRGRSKHEPVNPHYRGSAGASRVKMTSFDHQLGMDVELEIIQGTQVRQARQLIFKEASGAVHHLLIPEKMRDPKQLRAEFDKLGVKDIVEGRVIYDPEESHWVEPLVQAVWPNVVFAEGQLGATSYQSGATVKFELSDRYFRAVAKIGFHYFLTQFRSFIGSERQFEKIRQYILHGGPVSLANEFIGERQHPLLGNLIGGGKPDGCKAHVLAAEITEQSCVAHVQLFLCEDFRPRIYTVALGPNEGKAARTAYGHFYAYYNEGPRGKYSGEVDTLSVGAMPYAVLPLKPVIAEPD